MAIRLGLTEITEKLPPDYEYIALYQKQYANRNRTCIIYKCPHHGVKDALLSTFGRYNAGCRECYDIKQAHSVIDYINLAEEHDVEYIGPLPNTVLKKCWWRCKNGHKSFVTYNSIDTHGFFCSICNESRLERLTRIYLEKENIDYIKEYVFNDCVYQRVLPFDFYLPKHNAVIECHGKQHYEYTKFYHRTLMDFIERQHKDSIRKKYASENGVTYIEIPYDKQKEIGDIINNSL